MKKLLLILFAILMVTGDVYAASYYVSKSGDNTDGTSWAKAWTSFSSINWKNCAAGDILYIDEGRYEEKLVVEGAGTPTTTIGKTTYETLYGMSNTDLAADGWLVIAAGASDGVLNSEVRICGAKLTGKASGQYEGTANSGYSQTSGQTNTYEVEHSTAVDAVFELSTTDLTTKDAATALTAKTSIATVEAAAGSYWYDSESPTPKLYIHKVGSGNVAESTNDFEAVIGATADVYPLDISGTDGGIVFDGGASRLLRLSYGDSSIHNGIIKNKGDQENIIFRNMKMLYADTSGHFMNPNYDKGIFYNCEMGKVYDNQGVSFSASATKTVSDMYVINNIIWDGFETHGSGAIVITLTNWYVNGNTFKFEKLDSNNDYGFLKLYYVTITNGDIQIKNNTFTDMTAWFDAESTANNNLGVIQAFPYTTTNTGTIEISGNNIPLSTPTAGANGKGITVAGLGRMTCNIDGNTVSGLSKASQYAMFLLAGTNNEIINISNNTVSSSRYCISGSASTTGAGTLNLYRNTILTEIATSFPATKIVNNLNMYQNYIYATTDTNINFIALTGLVNVNIYNNTINLTENTIRLSGISGSCNIYGNIIKNNADWATSRSVWLRDSGWTQASICNNVFYNHLNDSTIQLDTTLTSAITVPVKNNIFYGNFLCLLDSSTNASFSSDYNYYYNNTTNVSGTSLGSHDVNGVDPKMVSVSADSFGLLYDSPCINAGVNLGSTYNDALHPLTDYSDPDTIFTADQDNFGSGWEIGAYVYVPGGLH